MSTYKSLIILLGEVHTQLDYELTPPLGLTLCVWNINKLYMHRDELLSQLKAYRR